MSHHTRRRRQCGNTTLLGALMLLLALGLFALVSDGALLYASKSRLETYAQEVARAGATAIDLNGATGSGRAFLNPALAKTQANDYFEGLKLGPTYSMRIVQVTLDGITVEISHAQPVYLIAAFVPIHSVQIVVQASAVPKVGF